LPLVLTAAGVVGLVMAVLDGDHAAADTDDAVGAALGKIAWALPENIGRPTATMPPLHPAAVPGALARRP
jgi:hypothetical protein